MSRNGNGATRLIVNADDFGWSRGITDGILHAHRSGVVSSASLMVAQPASEYALAQMQSVPKLGVGIHLTLCDGAPVLPAGQVPSLVDSAGNFYSDREVIRRLRKRQFESREIEAEFRAQIRWMKDRGLMPTHADSHHHVHLYPVAIHAFHQALKAEGVKCARPPRNRYFPKGRQLAGQHAGPVYRRVAVSAYMSYVQAMVLGDLKLPDWCLLYNPKFRGNDHLLYEGWRDGLENLEPGTYELCCHPGLSEAGFSENDSIKEKREMEIRLFTGRDSRNLIERKNIKLISYAEL